MKYPTCQKKASGYELISTEFLQNLPNKVVAEIATLFKAFICFKYFPTYWKVAKPGKPYHYVSSYRPISLLPMLSIYIYIFGTNTRNRARPRTYSKLWSA